VSHEERGRPGLLVDWGGVMTTDVFASFAAFCGEEGLAPDAVTRVLRSDPTARGLLAGLETGEVPESEFEQGLGRLLGVSAPGLIVRLMARTRPEPRMLAAVRTARTAGVRTGVVSNSWGSGGYPKDVLDELFDGVVISGEVGHRKPSREIYLLGARAIGLEPASCVFVDDLGGNLKPALGLGMAVVHHTSVDATLARLTGLLGVDLAGPEPSGPEASGTEPAGGRNPSITAHGEVDGEGAS
jgi:putative hydrolase of the HAD superfamily